MASVHIIKSTNVHKAEDYLSRDADILFVFVINGSMQLVAEDYETKNLKLGDAYVIPPNLKYKMINCSSNLELLEVALSGNYKTIIYKT